MLFRSNDTATTEIYTLSLHDALPIYTVPGIKYRNVDKKLLEKHGIHPDYIDDGLTSYINLCHRVGYEVVIRPQKGTQGDTECNPAATDKRLKKLYRKYMQLLSLRRPYRF